MKRKLLAGAGVVLALIGCRTLVGIDDLEFNPGPPQNDGGSADAGNDATGDRIATCQGKGGGCRDCCKGAFNAVPSTFDHGRGAQCVCSVCSRECDAGTPADAAAATCYLGGQGNSGGPDAAQAQVTIPDDCVRCEDNTLADTHGQCTNACGNDANCQAGIACLQACP